MEDDLVTCTICGAHDPSEHRVTRGLIVFCCADCAPLIEDVHTSFRKDDAVA